MYFVQVRYSTNRADVGRSVRYVAHREEDLPEGQKGRELYGVGERYRALRGDEKEIIRLLRSDGQGLEKPRYYRIRLTVDDRAADRIQRFGPQTRERVLRDAVEKAFRGVLRDAQGVYGYHENAMGNRPFGNPHVHVLLSPRGADGKSYYMARARLARFKERWEREVGRVIERQERRLPESPREKGPSLAERLAARRRGERSPRQPIGTLAAQLVRGRGPAAAATLARSRGGLVGRAARLQRELEQLGTAPELLLKRRAFELLSRLMPTPLRRSLGFARTISRIIPR